MTINLTKIPADQLTDYYRELLRRGWVWLVVADPIDAIRRDELRRFRNGK